MSAQYTDVQGMDNKQLNLFEWASGCAQVHKGSLTMDRCISQTKAKAEAECTQLGGACAGIAWQGGAGAKPDPNAEQWAVQGMAVIQSKYESYCKYDDNTSGVVKDPTTGNVEIGSCKINPKNYMDGTEKDAILIKTQDTNTYEYTAVTSELDSKQLNLFEWASGCAQVHKGSLTMDRCISQTKAKAEAECTQLGGACAGIAWQGGAGAKPDPNAEQWAVQGMAVIQSKYESYCKYDDNTSGVVKDPTTGNVEIGSCKINPKNYMDGTEKDAILIKTINGNPGEHCGNCDNCKPGQVCIGETKTPASLLGLGDSPTYWVVCDGPNPVADGKNKLIPLDGAKPGSTLASLKTKSGDPPGKDQLISLCPQTITFTPPKPYPTNKPTSIAHYINSGLSAELVLDGGWCLASTTKIPKVVNGNIQQVEVKDLKDGDMIHTTRGDFPLSHIMHTTTVGPHTYVKVKQGALGENLPSQDLYLTHEHSFSLGYYKNSVLNRNIHDPAQDDMVYLHITADQLADKLPGITRVQKEFDAMFNLVFDEHVSLDIYGLEVMMHHPKGNPYILPEEKYQDKTKINNKVQKPLFVMYGMLENVKPDHMEMKDFLRNCITANLDNKFRLENINHPSFAPQKTMLSEDMQKKLRVN